MKEHVGAAPRGGGGGNERKGRKRERQRKRERSMVVEKVRETRPSDIPPVKGGLVGGGGESSASLSIVLSVASATHFPTYARVHAREACPRARLPAVNPAECRERRLYLPLSSCPLPSFRVIELYSTLLHRNGNARRYRRNCRRYFVADEEG